MEDSTSVGKNKIGEMIEKTNIKTYLEIKKIAEEFIKFTTEQGFNFLGIKI